MFQSNQTSTRIAEEVIGTPKTLPGTPVWEPVEPNSFKDFGGEVKTVKREPIASDRQNRKGTVSDFDVSAAYSVDFTTRSLLSTLQGFMFASWRRKAQLAATAVALGSYTVAANGTNFVANDLVWAEDFPTVAFNGLKLATASTGTSVSVAGLTVSAETGTINKVGFAFTAGDLTLTVAGSVATIGATAKNLTQLGLIPGEWFWLGGDAVSDKLATAACNGFYRAKTIAAGSIVCDRMPDNAVTDAGAGKTVRLFLGNALKNEDLVASQVSRTYQIERQDSTSQFEYLLGMMTNQLKLTTKTADKMTAELMFVGLDTDTTQVSAKAGTRPAIKPQSAFSSSSDFTRLRLLNDVSNVTLATFITDIDVTIDNGVDVDKAIGTLGGVGFSLGNFMVSGAVEVYFTSMAAVDAVKANTTCALDFGVVANVDHSQGPSPQGFIIDIPAVVMGDARLKVEKDKKIKLPLNLDAFAHSTYNHTLLLVHFPYLPALAL